MKVSSEEAAAGALTPENLHNAARTFYDAGYVELEGAYDLEFIRQIRQSYDLLLQKYIEKRGGMDSLEGKTFGQNHVGYHPELVMPMADERLVAPPLAVQVMTELLGPHFQCGFYNTNTAMPGSGTQKIHRDSGSLFGAKLPTPHPVVSLVLNIPLCDFNLENGSTEVWPGSHLLVDADPADEKRLEERAQWMPSVRTHLKAGSLVLRDLRMWHRGMPNNADYPRTMIALVYTRHFMRTGTLDIPRATWESWGEDARDIFRNNRIVEEEAADARAVA